MSQIVNKFLAQMPTLTIKGNNTGGTANVKDLTVAQVNLILPVFTSTLNGLTPLSGGGTTNFLRADGTWAAPSGSGSVTSVAFADASSSPIYAVSGSPVTSSGTLTITLSNQTANTVFAGPASGGAAQPAFRALVNADVGTLTVANISASSNSTLTTLSALSLPGSQVTGNISGNAGNVTGIVAIANGGTGQSTANAGFAALSPMTTAGDIIYENSTPVPARLPIGSTGQVLTVVGGLPAWAASGSDIPNKETFVLSGTDITNQYVDLAHVARTNSILFQVKNAGALLEGASYDYSVSYTGGAGGNTRITFLNDLATGGNAALVATDVVQVNYVY